MYDYGFRVHDARLGRFLSVDPLAPDYPWYTPYQYAGNKPIRFIDLDGLEERLPYKASTKPKTNIIAGELKVLDMLNSPKNQANSNWFGVEAGTFVSLRDHLKQNGYCPQFLVIDMHGAPGGVQYTDPLPSDPSVNGSLTGGHLMLYSIYKTNPQHLKKLETINPDWSVRIKSIIAVEETFSLMQDGGTIVLTGCGIMQGVSQDYLNFSEFDNLTDEEIEERELDQAGVYFARELARLIPEGKDINIYLNSDRTIAPTRGGGGEYLRYFDTPMSNSNSLKNSWFAQGWYRVSKEGFYRTGKDLVIGSSEPFLKEVLPKY